MELKFYLCKHCGNVVVKAVDKKPPISCCGEKMVELIPGSVDASQEKHVPAVTVKCKKVTVNVGEVLHPMTPEHYINFVAVETTNGVHVKNFTPEDAPEAVFSLADGEKLVNVYAYCNLHGLWKYSK